LRIEFLARGVCAEVDGDEPLVVATLFDLAGATGLGFLYSGLFVGLPGFGGLNFLTALGGIIQKAPLAHLTFHLNKSLSNLTRLALFSARLIQS